MRRFPVISLSVCVLLLSGIGCPRPGLGQSSSEIGHGHARAHTADPAEHPSVYPDRIVLTWEKNPARTLSVTWRTHTSVERGRVQIAPATAGPSFFTRGRTVEATTELLDPSEVPGESLSAHFHSATVEGLDPNTLYAYRVGDGEHWSEWFHTRTAAAGEEPFSFIYFGDAQNGVDSHWPRAIRAAYAKAPDARFLLHAGDLVNNAHRNLEWGWWNEAGAFIQSMLPNVPVPGNHEYEPFETWMERDTFGISVTAHGTSMEGTITEPDGGGEPLRAERSDPASDGSGLGGDWAYNVDEGEYLGTLRIEEGARGYTGTLIPESGGEIPLQDVSVEDDRMEAEFLMEVEKEGPEHLSVQWRPQFTLPKNGPEGMEETVYYMDYQDTRIIALNTNLRDSASLARQTEWLEGVLQDTGDRWTVVTFHHPIFSSGEGRDNADLRELWPPLFDEYQVDIVMQGHDHTYARGRIKNLTQGVNTRSPAWGTVYVNSVSGAKMYEIKEGRWDRYDGIDMQRGAENTQLFQTVHVSSDTLSYRSYTVTGELYDAFDLVNRPGGASNEMIEHPVTETEERTHENTVPYEGW